MKKSTSTPKSQTDWQQLNSMNDEAIDFSDIPEITPDMFAKAVVRRGIKMPVAKAQLTLRIDQDVLNWFKAQGSGYQTRMNALLRAYMEANQAKETQSTR